MPSGSSRWKSWRSSSDPLTHCPRCSDQGGHVPPFSCPGRGLSNPLDTGGQTPWTSVSHCAARLRKGVREPCPGVQADSGSSTAIRKNTVLSGPLKRFFICRVGRVLPGWTGWTRCYDPLKPLCSKGCGCPGKCPGESNPLDKAPGGQHFPRKKFPPVPLVHPVQRATNGAMVRFSVAQVVHRLSR